MEQHYFSFRGVFLSTWSPLFTLFSSVFGLLQLLREISVSLAAKWSTMFTVFCAEQVAYSGCLELFCFKQLLWEWTHHYKWPFFTFNTLKQTRCWCKSWTSVQTTDRGSLSSWTKCQLDSLKENVVKRQIKAFFPPFPHSLSLTHVPTLSLRQREVGQSLTSPVGYRDAVSMATGPAVRAVCNRTL